MLCSSTTRTTAAQRQNIFGANGGAGARRVYSDNNTFEHHYMLKTRLYKNQF